MPSFIRILIVEDFQPFRRIIRAELAQRAEFQIVGEVADGLEAVQKAVELQPDLVMIDIGLPGLNGVEAARRIHRAVPGAKLLFVSMESSSSIVKETFMLGGHGYVDKMRAKMDLLPGVDAVVAGRKFLSSGLEYAEADETDKRHDVHFYSDDAVLLEAISEHILTGLRAGNPAIVMATNSHRESLAERLKGYVDLDQAIQRGSYIALDAMDRLSESMVHGSPDRARFFEELSRLIGRAARSATTENPRVSIYGECAALLCAEGNANAAIQLEKAGNELMKSHSIDILCGYPMSAFDRGDGEGVFKSICAEHTAVRSE